MVFLVDKYLKRERGMSGEVRLMALRQIMSGILKDIRVAAHDNESLLCGLSNPQFKDIEDGCQYELAKKFSNTFKTDTSSITGNQATALKKEIIEAVKEGKNLEEIQRRVKEVYQEQLDIQKQKRQELEKEKQNATNNLNNQLSSVSKVGFRTNNFKEEIKLKIIGFSDGRFKFKILEPLNV